MKRKWKSDIYPFIHPPEDSDLEKLFTREELLEDLQYMMDTYFEVHPNLLFSLSQHSLSNQLEKLQEKLTESHTRIDFYRRVAPLAASFNDGHTMVSVPHEESLKSDEIGKLDSPLRLSVLPIG